MFDPPTQRYPKKLAEMSFDYKLMFVYHGSMMLLFVIGQRLSVRQEITLTGSLVVVLVALSLRRRSIENWRWPSVTTRNVLGAVFGVLLIGFFLYSATPLFPPSNPVHLPWYLGGLGIGTFGILGSLRVVDASGADFQLSCREIDEQGREIERAPEAPPPANNEANWKKVARGIFSVTFALIWVGGVASFFVYGKTFRQASPEPTATQDAPLVDHGHTVYITRAEKRQVDGFEMVSWIGIPIVLVSGFVLHFLVGVKLFPNAPTLVEYTSRWPVQPPPKP